MKNAAQVENPGEKRKNGHPPLLCAGIQSGCSFRFQVNQNVFRRSLSPAKGSRLCSLGKFLENGVKSCNFMHSDGKNRVIAACSTKKIK